MRRETFRSFSCFRKESPRRHEKTSEESNETSEETIRSSVEILYFSRGYLLDEQHVGKSAYSVVYSRVYGSFCLVV